MGIWAPNIREWIITQLAAAQTGLILVSVTHCVTVNVFYALMAYINLVPRAFSLQASQGKGPGKEVGCEGSMSACQQHSYRITLESKDATLTAKSYTF